MYVTINDIILNEGTEHEQRRPFEVFINSKNLDHYQWIVALTRIISAVFRKGGDVTFLVEELKAVFDPRGGYWQPGGKIHAVDHRRARSRDRKASADHRPDGAPRTRRASKETRRREACGIRSPQQTGRRVRESRTSRRARSCAASAARQRS
jgi:hypothetical protein